MNMLAKSVLPFSFVDDEGFVELMQEAVPRYKVPSRMYFRDVMLPTEYEQLSLKLRAALETVKHVGLTTDLWTSAANEGYITITCHYITENFKLTSALLSTAPLITPTNHNAQNIADSISSMLAKWGLLSKVVTVTTDNDTTMKKACDILAFYHLPCLAHTINLLAQDILKLAAVNGIISKCKRIVTYFKQSTIATAKLKEVQNTNQPLVLIQEVSTRWNSAHAMIKRILQINEYVTLTLLKLRNGPSPITTDKLEVLDDLSDLLSPFQEATLSVSTNTKVSVSLIIPVIAENHHKMNQLNAKLRTQEGKDIYDLVKKRLVERLDTFETRTIPRIATLVDPRFKKDGFLRPSNADQAAKALELELLSFKSTTPRRPPTPPEPTSNEPNFRFSFLQNKSKVKSTRADAIITTRQFMEKENAPCTCDPLK
ncbi:E3 SUMO-protein ligase ZBED1-like isoform X2 [Drosophila sulfurigaster albostrigata]|nr:E3 SUMO-protein ligase ZBED1-like isoform X2 [Drosophila sulfurigaster albostrigata]